MNKLNNLFRRGRKPSEPVADEEPLPLRIEGVPEAPLTPEPDDAELAAQALLEMMLGAGNRQSDSADEGSVRRHEGDGQPVKGASPHDAAYYHHLAAKIRQAHIAQRKRTMRFVSFCEQELRKTELPPYGPGSLGLLEAELLKRLDIIEREGGELKRRWQHCLANVTVRLMQAQQDGALDPNEPAEQALSYPQKQQEYGR